MRFFTFTSAFLLSLIMSSSVFASPIPDPKKTSIERPRPARDSTMNDIKNGDNGRTRQQRRGGGFAHEDAGGGPLFGPISTGRPNRPGRRDLNSDLEARDLESDIEAGANRARPQRDLNSDSEARDLESDIEAGANRTRPLRRREGERPRPKVLGRDLDSDLETRNNVMNDIANGGPRPRPNRRRDM